MRFDPLTKLPFHSGFDHIIEWLNSQHTKSDDLKGFEKAYEALVDQLKLSSHSELLFFLRTNLAKKDSMQIDFVTKILTTQMAEEHLTDLESWVSSKYGVTKDSLIEKMAFLLNYRKLQMQAEVQNKYENSESFDFDFLEKDPFFKTVNPEVRKTIRNDLSFYKSNSQAFAMTSDFEEFDFEGLVTGEFDPIEVDMQKRYFYKKAQLLPELLGIEPSKFIKIFNFFDSLPDEEAEGYMGRTLQVEDAMELLGFSEEDMVKMNIRKRRTNQYEPDDKEFRQNYEEIKEKIPQLEEYYDYTPLKEILYNYDTLKTLDSKITKLEKSTKMYDLRQPRIAELQKKLNMLVDALPGNIRKFLNNKQEDFTPEFMGKEYKVKNLNWKIVDKDLPLTVLDYTDSTPNLTMNELRLLTPTEMNIYLDEVFNWYKPGKINLMPIRNYDPLYEHEVTAFGDDLYRDYEKIKDGELKNEESDEEEEKFNTLKYTPSKLYDETQLILEDYSMPEGFMDDIMDMNPRFNRDPHSTGTSKEEAFLEIEEEFNMKQDTEINPEDLMRLSLEVSKNGEMDDEYKIHWSQEHHDLRSQRIQKIREGDTFENFVEFENYADIDLQESIEFFNEDEDSEEDSDAEEKEVKKMRKELADEDKGIIRDLDNDEEEEEIEKVNFRDEYWNNINQMNKLYDDAAIHSRTDFNRTEEDKKFIRWQREDFDPNNQKGLKSYEHNFIVKDYDEIEVSEDDNERNMDKEEIYKSLITEEDQLKFKDLENIQGNFSMNRNSQKDFLNEMSAEEMYSPYVPLEYHPEIDDYEFYRAQNSMRLYDHNKKSNYDSNFYEQEMGGVFQYDSAENENKDRFFLNTTDSSQNKHSFEVHRGFRENYIIHLRNRFSNILPGLQNSTQNKELQVYKVIDQDPYFQHYMSKNFKHMSVVNSEMMMDKMSEINNPDLGFLLDARMDLSKLANSTKSSGNIIMDLKTNYDLSSSKINKARNRKNLKQGRVSSFASAHRKRSSALAVIQYPGTGKVSVNRRNLIEYFGDYSSRYDVIKPVTVARKNCQVDMKVYVHGGGIKGQGQACRLAVAKAVIKMFPDSKPDIFKAGFLRIDMRSVESKKTSKPKARKSHTYVRR
jgi:small subunit ribosomal protein S9